MMVAQLIEPPSVDPVKEDTMRYLMVTSCLLLGACGTMAGMGQDMQSAGAKLENRATVSQRPPPAPPSEVMAYPDPDRI